MARAARAGACSVVEAGRRAAEGGGWADPATGGRGVEWAHTAFRERVQTMVQTQSATFYKFKREGRIFVSITHHILCSSLGLYPVSPVASVHVGWYPQCALLHIKQKKGRPDPQAPGPRAQEVGRGSASGPAARAPPPTEPTPNAQPMAQPVPPGAKQPTPSTTPPRRLLARHPRVSSNQAGRPRIRGGASRHGRRSRAERLPVGKTPGVPQEIVASPHGRALMRSTRPPFSTTVFVLERISGGGGSNTSVLRRHSSARLRVF